MRAKHLCMGQGDQLVESKLFTIWIVFELLSFCSQFEHLSVMCIGPLLVVMRVELWLTYVHFCIAKQ